MTDAMRCQIILCAQIEANLHRLDVAECRRLIAFPGFYHGRAVEIFLELRAKLLQERGDAFYPPAEETLPDGSKVRIGNWEGRQ